MSSSNKKVLAELVARVIKTGESAFLANEHKERFHREFEAEIADKAERLREEKRRAYEYAKNVVVR